MDFQGTGVASTGGNQEILVDADASLPNYVCIVTATDNWKIKIGTKEFAIGSSGAGAANSIDRPHKIYVTYATPAGSAVTEKRVEAVCIYAAGKVDLVEPLSLAAIVAGADGLMIEMHPTPETALSDGAQSLDPAQFRKVAGRIKDIVAWSGKTLG